MIQPSLCHPDAFRLFAEQLENLDSADGLIRAAVAVSLHALEDSDPETAVGQLDALADRVRRGVRSNRPEALLAHVHHVLFEEEEFMGDFAGFFSPLNSFLPAVLESRRGIPITLGLIYRAVAEKVGLRVRGIEAPNYFFAEVECGDRWMIVDPFFKGRLLTRAEAEERAQFAAPRLSLAASGGPMRPAEDWMWIAHLLRHLQNLLAESGRHLDLAAMTELQSLLYDQAA